MKKLLYIVYSDFSIYYYRWLKFNNKMKMKGSRETARKGLSSYELFQSFIQLDA